MLNRLIVYIRSKLITGLLVIIPTAITVLVLVKLFEAVDNILGPWVEGLLGDKSFWGVGILAVALLVFLVGFAASTFLGRRFLALWERAIAEVPVAKTLYGALKQLIEAFRATSGGAFQRVVMIQYPRPGLYSLGFVTSMKAAEGGCEGAGRVAHVFIPSTPNPTSGWLILVPEEEIIEPGLTVEEAMRLIVSGGIVAPDGWGPRIEPAATSGSEVRDRRAGFS